MNRESRWRHGLPPHSPSADCGGGYGAIAGYLPETAVLENEVERILDPDAEDILWFSLKKGDMHFKIGLSDILMCLKFAEEQGEVPELPRMWWTRLSGTYPKLHFSAE